MATTTVTNITTVPPEDTMLKVTDIAIGDIDERTQHIENIPLSCSIDGTTSITYSITEVVGSVLGWATIDETSQTLVLNPPDLLIDTDFEITLDTVFNGVTYPRTVTFTVIDVPVSESKTSSPTKELIYTAVAAGTATLVGMGSSMFSSKSSSSMWLAINYYQMLMILPLLNIYIGQKLVKYFEGLDVALFSLSFLQKQKSVSDSPIYGYFKCEEPNQYLVNIEIPFCSTILNVIQMIILFAGVGLLHSVVSLLMICCKSKKNMISNLLFSLFKTLTFTFYIRAFIESYMIFVISG